MPNAVTSVSRDDSFVSCNKTPLIQSTTSMEAPSSDINQFLKQLPLPKILIMIQYLASSKQGKTIQTKYR